jgi:hypothetical protein
MEATLLYPVAPPLLCQAEELSGVTETVLSQLVRTRSESVVDAGGCYAGPASLSGYLDVFGRRVRRTAGGEGANHHYRDRPGALTTGKVTLEMSHRRLSAADWPTVKRRWRRRRSE